MRLAICLLVLVSAVPSALAQAPWHDSLYLPGGGHWLQRIAVSVNNEADHAVAGETVALPIGSAAGAAQLVGADARAIRVCNAQGTELLYRITNVAGNQVLSGPIPSGAALLLPADVGAHASANVYVYFDNPSAWAVPDYLAGTLGLSNGGVEKGDGSSPEAWTHDEGDGQHKASWSDEAPHAGKKCLKTQVAAGATSSWVATRQQQIHISGGARYRLRGWVRAQNVKGVAGWYVHMGNAAEPMIIGPVLNAGEGSYAWKQVSQEIAAPAGATTAAVGTVLYGTGKAWFDDVELTCLTPEVSKLRAIASAPERLTLAEQGATGEPAAAKSMDYRVPLRVANVSGQPVTKALALVDVGALVGSMGIVPGELLVADGADVIAHGQIGGRLFFEASVAPKTIHTYSLYIHAASARPAANQKQAYQKLLESPANLVRNPSFEADPLSPPWKGYDGAPPAGVQLAAVAGGLFGERSSKLTVAGTLTTGWNGWKQDVPIQAGHRYLLAGWIKSGRLAGGDARIHAHFRNAGGELCAVNPYTSTSQNITANQDWTMLSGVYTMPADGAIFQVHLTLNGAGEVQHDGILVAEVIDAVAGAPQPVAAPAAAGAVAVWPVNPIIKVFQQFVLPAKATPASLSACRGETEPLQLAVRAGRAVGRVQVQVEPPANASGRRLTDARVAVVGYVPVDHPTNYYQSAQPDWQRKYPTTEGSCDGWAGMWPDPLIPTDSFQLNADQTAAVWVSFAMPRDAAAGDYKGAVTLRSGDAVIAQVPLTVHVWDFEIPAAASLKAVFDVRMDAPWQIPGKDATTALRDFWKFMAEHRACPDRIQPEPVLDYRDGKVVADFTEFDKAAEVYFDQLKLPHSYTPWVFYGFGWGMPPDKKFGQAPYAGEYPYKDADRSQLRPEFKKAYQACLKAYWDHMKARGWADRVTLYISDEPFDAEAPIRKQMTALCQMIHEVDKSIPIYSSTWHPQPEWNGQITVWGAGNYGVFPVDVMKARQAAGDTIWYTIDGQMCMDTPYSAVERLLPYYCFKYGVKAYEFWGANWLTYDPWQFGWHRHIHQTDAPGKSYDIRYPNGDGYIAYPGRPVGADGPVSSVRLEQIRDGMEDYEYLHLLEQQVRAAKLAGRDVAAATAALDEARALVSIPNAGGKYSLQILPDPDAVQKARTAVAQAIEQLGEGSKHD